MRVVQLWDEVGLCPIRSDVWSSDGSLPGGVLSGMSSPSSVRGIPSSSDSSLNMMVSATASEASEWAVDTSSEGSGFSTNLSDRQREWKKRMRGRG